MNRLPMNIQFFAEGGTGSDPSGNPSPAQGAAGQTGQQAPVIDYARIQQMLDGTLAAKEDTALKAYFRQQGLSQQEAEQAIEAFKQQKAANQPDVNALQGQVTEAQNQLAAAQAEARQAQLGERGHHGGGIPGDGCKDNPVCAQDGGFEPGDGTGRDCQ